jgi:ABC-type sugar transport system substrate-binding protein
MSEDEVKLRLGTGVSRRNMIKQMAGVGMLAGFAGCLGGGNSNDTEDQSDGGGDDGGGNGDYTPAGGGTGGQGGTIIETSPPPAELKMDPPEFPERHAIFVGHFSGPFMIPMISGFHDACQMYGWRGEFTAPNGIKIDKQVQLLNSAIDSGPDLIVVPTLQQEPYRNALQRAIENDIVVVQNNVGSWGRQESREELGSGLAYVGQNNYTAGLVAGRILLRKLPDDATTAAIGTTNPDSTSLIDRANGIKDAVRANSDIEFVETVNYGGNAEQGVTKLQNLITANPDLDGIVGTDAFSWFVGEAIEQSGNTDSIVGGGFDLPTKTLEFIQSGALDFTIGQDPYSQGHLPVTLGWTYLQRGMPPKNYNTHSEVIDQDNVDFALERSEAFTQLREYHRSQ